jgi:hypothetical protein
MNLWVVWKVWTFLTSWGAVSCWKRTLLHGLSCWYCRSVLIVDFQVQFVWKECTSLKMSVQNNDIFKRDKMMLSCGLYYICDFSYKYYTHTYFCIYVCTYLSLYSTACRYVILWWFADVERYLCLQCAVSSCVLLLFRWDLQDDNMLLCIVVYILHVIVNRCCYILLLCVFFMLLCLVVF